MYIYNAIQSEKGGEMNPYRTHLLCVGPSARQLFPQTFSPHNFFSFFLGFHVQHMEFPSLGVDSELQLLAHATATQQLRI